MRKILSIDGGGIRGIIPALILSEIENRTGRNIPSLFDMIAGTSTGGIIALCLSKHDGDDKPVYGAYDLVNLYGNQGREIFSRSFWKGVSSIAGIADEKYSHEALEGLLWTYLGDDVMGASLTRVMVTAYDIEERRPFFLKSWDSEIAKVSMRIAARATSAAPTYFEPEVVVTADGCQPHALVDGGVCVNNPAMCAYAEAKRLWPDEDILVVSLGTGELTRPIPYEDARNWGLAEWALPILSVLMDGMSDAVDYQLRQILAGNFYRFQGRLDLANDDMDDASARNIEALKKEAAKIVIKQERDLELVCEMLRIED